MRLENVTDISEILKLVPIEVEIAKKENQRFAMPIKDKLEWIKCMVSGEPIFSKHELRIIFVYDDEKKIVGYTLASLSVSKIKYFSEIRVYRVWRDRHSNTAEIMQLMDKELKDWARESKVHVMRMETESRFDHWKDKWGFNSVSLNMERRI